ncbi:disease resistance protein RPV1-like [Rosa chinensis]|uniref:disease resistance protein RPV1-like n=1 Tax=Rosa chinensis TaxID=74649 RepID=UPI000D087D0A|nr:disease resistance protein RPV1-like [Rosa chinensis]
MVRPIFYKVDPADVRYQKGNYGEALAKHERRFPDNLEKVGRWRRALTRSANLSGWHYKEQEYESTFIDNIVEEISLQLLNQTYLDVAEYPIGIDSRVQDIDKLLSVSGNSRCIIGIWGSPGLERRQLPKLFIPQLHIDLTADGELNAERERAREIQGVLDCGQVDCEEMRRVIDDGIARRMELERSLAVEESQRREAKDADRQVQDRNAKLELRGATSESLAPYPDRVVELEGQLGTLGREVDRLRVIKCQAGERDVELERLRKEVDEE